MPKWGENYPPDRNSALYPLMQRFLGFPRKKGKRVGSVWNITVNKLAGDDYSPLCDHSIFAAGDTIASRLVKIPSKTDISWARTGHWSGKKMAGKPSPQLLRHQWVKWTDIIKITYIDYGESRNNIHMTSFSRDQEILWNEKLKCTDHIEKKFAKIPKGT